MRILLAATDAVELVSTATSAWIDVASLVVAVATFFIVYRIIRKGLHNESLPG